MYAEYRNQIGTQKASAQWFHVELQCKHDAQRFLAELQCKHDAPSAGI